MTDVLIRDVPEAVVAALDARASRLGLSRSEYLRRRLAQDAVTSMRTLTRLEVGYSARSGPVLRSAARRPPLAAMPVEYQTPASEDRAVEVQALLADKGHHRAPSIPDLVVAATAELGGLTVLHLDKDFELIAEITGQPMERLGPE